jgi:hypothetical protein
MGISSKKTTSTTDTTSNVNQDTSNTTRPFNPDWVTNPVQGLTGRIDSYFSGLDPQSLVAGPNALQTQGADSLSHLTGSPWNFDGAADLTRGVAAADAPSVQGVRANGYINDYMNPYTDSVVNSSLAGFDQNANQTRQGQMLDLAGDSTFGGSGGSILRSLTEGQLGLSRGQLEGGLRSQGFNTALTAAQADADREQNARTTNAQMLSDTLNRRLTAGGQLANLSTSYDANQRANADAQMGAGDTLRGIDQQGLLAPTAASGLEGGLLSNLPLDMFHGSDATGSLSGTATGTSNTKGKTSGASLMTGWASSRPMRRPQRRRGADEWACLVEPGTATTRALA